MATGADDVPAERAMEGTGRSVSAPDRFGLARRFAGLNHVLVGDFVLGRTSRRYASLLALVVAAVIGCATYVTEGWIWNGELSLRPDMVSTLTALALVFPLYARRLIEWAPSVYSLLSLVLNVTITAILVRALLGGSGWGFFGLPMPYLVVFAVILTWAGMRPLAPIVWALVLVVGFINLKATSDAMGFWGYFFIILAAVGVVLQLPSDTWRALPELRREFSGGPSPRRLAKRAGRG